MLYERPQVWLIDDVSSALDILTEKKLSGTLYRHQV
jgi:ABC-type nitrate/sulfonate/bicarbonate transport system ATPase subunit